ncbi:MAG: helix-turn-helix domain-containing protein [Desulfobaccales bacterium]
MTALSNKRSFLAFRFAWIRYRLFLKRVVFFAAIGLVFFCLALCQHWFFHEQIYSTASQELASWAVQIADEIAYKTKWDLNGYRNAQPIVPSWFVVTEDGFVIDIEGFIPDLFGKAEPVDDSIFNSPKTVLTPTGETWRVFGRRVSGGAVIVGIYSPDEMKIVDAMLLKNAAKFGTTIKEATSIKTREIDYDVDYAVVTNDGEIKYAIGGVPLNINPHSLLHLSEGTTPFISNGKPYLLYSKPLLNSANQRVGMVIVPKDMSLEQRALQIQDRFNYIVVGVAGILITVAFCFFIGRELLNRANKITVQEALKSGESLKVEFKSTFQWDVNLGQPRDERMLDTLKSIAGFLNTKGGTLFIGVEENRAGPLNVCGINEDLKLNGGSKDRLQRKLRDLITERIGAKFSPFIEEKFEEEAGQLCWVVFVTAAPEPAFVRWKKDKKFYVRQGPRTSDLDKENTWHYIKNRWG